MNRQIRIPALLRLANGAPCANCGAQDGTVVAAHSNLGIHGKGMGMKAHDCFVAFLCYRCHSWFDEGLRPTDPTGRYCVKELMFQRAMEETWKWLWKNDKLAVKP